jgi:hypothetical protein
MPLAPMTSPLATNRMPAASPERETEVQLV